MFLVNLNEVMLSDQNLVMQFFRATQLQQPHFDLLDKIMNVLLHVTAGKFRVLFRNRPVNIFHLVEDFLVGDNLAQGGTPQARAAVMKVVQKFL